MSYRDVSIVRLISRAPEGYRLLHPVARRETRLVAFLIRNVRLGCRMDGTQIYHISHGTCPPVSQSVRFNAFRGFFQDNEWPKNPCACVAFSRYFRDSRLG